VPKGDRILAMDTNDAAGIVALFFWPSWSVSARRASGAVRKTAIKRRRLDRVRQEPRSARRQRASGASL
jgi:hypothetical protein